MAGREAGRRPEAAPTAGTGGWSAAAKWSVSGLLAFHLASQVVVQFAAQPASLVERALATPFEPYYGLFDLGHSYRYYAPEPGPTPVVTARLTFEDGRPEREIRLPDRSLTPRLRYQRHLNLANHLFDDAHLGHDHDRGPDGERGSSWAASYARHLCRSNPGCIKVALFAQRHLLPSLELVYREGVPDVDDERFYEVPALIGEYACDDF